MTNFKDEILDAIEGLEMYPTAYCVAKLADEIELVKREREYYFDEDGNFFTKILQKTATNIFLPDPYEEIPDETIQKMERLEKLFDKNDDEVENLRKICKKYNQNIIDNELDKIEMLLSWEFLKVSMALTMLQMAISLNNMQAEVTGEPGFNKTDELNEKLDKVKTSADELKSKAYEHDEILKIIREKIKIWSPND